MPDVPRERVPFTALSERVIREHVLQHPGKPTIERAVVMGGPAEGLDRRLILHVEQLEQMLDVARSSLSQRCVVHHFGLRVVLLRENSPPYHRWQCVYLIGDPVVPEVAEFGVRLSPNARRG